MSNGKHDGDELDAVTAQVREDEGTTGPFDLAELYPDCRCRDSWRAIGSTRGRIACIRGSPDLTDDFKGREN